MARINYAEMLENITQQRLAEIEDRAGYRECEEAIANFQALGYVEIVDDDDDQFTVMRKME